MKKNLKRLKKLLVICLIGKLLLLYCPIILPNALALILLESESTTLMSFPIKNLISHHPINRWEVSSHLTLG